MVLNVITKTFDELSNVELYKLLSLRNEVFIVEQNCPYLDIDNKDQKCYHLLLSNNDTLVGYSRIIPAGLSYNEVSIGRVLIAPDFRGKGLGLKIVEESIQSCINIFGNVDIKIGAQFHLSNLYGSFGFIKDGEPYDEDGILHIDMIRFSNKDLK
ncbi:GNAT family N-acetyltransferase [Flavobacterium seoulense]|uniref:N-acetyltransferase domain-containing protein n=1 Tax=Flavobacterium seoulense TaxID=1492738 RepID=A0A066WXB3_9FLAO|nr:GNAT family N-acetyltransferase [Flavobacterium seoulense]KDN55285.1 hypothetical protein FEM21_15890 [Flavobacterium seoulense]